MVVELGSGSWLSIGLETRSELERSVAEGAPAEMGGGAGCDRGGGGAGDGGLGRGGGCQSERPVRSGTISVRMPPADLGWKKEAVISSMGPPKSMYWRPRSMKSLVSPTTSVEP